MPTPFVFYLTMEAFGKVHPTHRSYDQWEQMEEKERQLQRVEEADMHSIDLRAGVDIARVKQLYGDQVCLMGNVDCSALDSGSPEEIIASTRYALQSGIPGGGLIFSTSNCVYTGMPLENYEIMLDIWRKEGNYYEI